MFFGNLWLVGTMFFFPDMVTGGINIGALELEGKHAEWNSESWKGFMCPSVSQGSRAGRSQEAEWWFRVAGSRVHPSASSASILRGVSVSLCGGLPRTVKRGLVPTKPLSWQDSWRKCHLNKIFWNWDTNFSRENKNKPFAAFLKSNDPFSLWSLNQGSNV